MTIASSAVAPDEVDANWEDSSEFSQSSSARSRPLSKHSKERKRKLQHQDISTFTAKTDDTVCFKRISWIQLTSKIEDSKERANIILEIEKMGFKKSDIINAMEAASWNLDLALTFLVHVCCPLRE